MKTKLKILSVFYLFLISSFMTTNVEAVDWTTETVDSYGNVGEYSSLALDMDGWSHISYYDNSNDDLKYAYKDSLGWHRITIDDTGNVGTWSSIAIDNLGYPHISYYDDSNNDLKYAYKDNSGWHIETVDSYGNVGAGTDIALDNNDNPHIVYYGDYDGYRRIKHAYKDYSGWHKSWIVWDITGQNWYGRPFSIALDIYNCPHISYFDDNNLEYVYIYNSGTTWHWETVETGCGEGSGTSIVLDQNGYPHIAYNRESGEDLKYAYKDVAGWHIYTVDNDGDVGDCPSIALNHQGYPSISYYHQGNDELKYAYKDVSGWHIQTVSSYNNVGKWSSIALNYSDEPHISYYDDTNDNLKFARPQNYGPQTFTLLSPANGSWANSEPVFVWEPCSYQGDSLSHYELWIDGAWNKNVPKTQPFSKPAYPLSASWHTWNIKAVKIDGNSIWSNETWSVLVDDTPPASFDLISPDNNTWTSDRTPTLNWEISSDMGSGLKEYLLYIDGSLARVGIPPDYTSTTPLWNLSSGDHTWDIVAVDNAGNSTQSSQTWTIKIDYTDPNYFSLYAPDNYSYTSIDTTTFLWESTTDDGIGMSHYQLWIDNSMTIDSIYADTTLDTMSVTLDTLMALNHGSHYWKITAFDELGNYRNSSTWYLYIDIQPPYHFSLISPANNSLVNMPTPTFTWESTSDYTPTASGFDKYQLWIDDSLNVDNISDTSSAPCIPLSEGYHSWFVKAYDNVGNVRNSNEIWGIIVNWNPSFGSICGTVTLGGGTGNVENVEVTTQGITVNPNINGIYVINIAPGTYDVTASLEGYTDSTLVGVGVTGGQLTSGIDFILNPQISINEQNLIPIEIILDQNYPNPFNRRSIISYGLPKPCLVKIEIYNLKGQLVKTLVNDDKPAGYHYAEWIAENISSGIYFYKLETEDKTLIKKMILMR